jgi:hypothetical protein
MEFDLYSNGPPRVVSDCLGNNTPDIQLRDLINGMTFGSSGIYSRIWRVFRRNHRNDGGINTALESAGIMDCHGTVTFTSDHPIPSTSGVFVSCFPDCFTEVCADTLANAAAELSGPGNFYSQYVLVIDSTHAVCGECEPTDEGEDDL